MPATMTAPDEGIDTATHTISDSARATKLSLTMAWWGVCSALFYIFLAATLAVTYGTLNTITAIVLSVISYGVINGVLARYAINTGLSVSLFSRILLGKAGALLATAIFFLTATYYAVFEGSVIAVAASRVIGGLSYGWACLIVVALAVPMVFGSVQRFLDKLNGVLLPFYVLGLIAAVVATIATYGYSNAWLRYVPAAGAPANGWLHAYIAYMGVWVLMMFTVDYARFGAKKDATYHCRINFGMPFYVMTFLVNGLVGVFLITSGQVATVSETGVVEKLTAVLGGVVALLFIWVTQARINSANYYLATVNMQAFFEKLLRIRLRKWIWAIIVGTVVLTMMRATDVFGYILAALTYQGIFVTAWVGVAVTHVLSRRYRQMFGDRVYYHFHEAPNFNPAGLAAWFVAAGAGLVMTLSGVASGYAPVATVVLSVAIYAGLLRVAKPGWYAVAAEAPAGDAVGVTR